MGCVGQGIRQTKSVYTFGRANPKVYTRLGVVGGLNLPLESKFSPPNLEFGRLNLAPKFNPQKGVNS